MSHEYIWLNSQLQKGSSTYNIPAVFTITGPLNIAALEKSIDTVIKRHEAFRLTFSDQGRIRKHPPGKFNFFLEQIQPGNMITPDRLHQLITKEITRPFNLNIGPLIRASLIHLDKDKYILLIVMHHIITDLRSKELFGSQVSVCYDTIVKKRNLPSLDSPFLYSDHVTRRQEWNSSQPARAMLEFWKKEVQSCKGLLDLPLDHPRKPVAGSSGKAHFFLLHQEHSRNLHKFCRQRSIAPFVALLTCYLVLLARYCRQNNLVIGIPLTNRRHADDKDTMGCFINILPLAFELHKDLTMAQAMLLVRRKLLLAHRNQETAFHDIVAAVKPQREPSYNPIFQTGFTYEPPMELQLTWLRVETEKWHNQGSQLDIFLNIFEMTPEIRGYFEYNQDLFEPETIAGFSDHYQRLVRSLHQQAEIQLSRVEFLSQEERNRLLVQWNETETDYGEPQCLDKLVEKQVAETPTETAVIFDEVHLTYQQLNARANQLAHFLRKQGIGPENIVGIFMERSIEMVIAIYAILKAGGAYVPLEPGIPRQRVSFILNETKTKIVLTQQHLREKLPGFDGTTINLDTDRSEIARYPCENPGRETQPGNLAYVMYTSGSTGTPKGVMIEHGAICNRLLWMQETFNLEPEDRVLLKTPFSFDVSVWEFFWPLIGGAGLVVAPPDLHKNPVKLCRFIRQHKITTIHFVPSMLRLFLDVDNVSECQCLQRVICSGEELTLELQTSFSEKLTCGLHNLYGPTEAAIDVSCWHCRQQTPYQKVPIGFPIANTKLYILDEYLQPVPQGAIGELYIGGVQVARGYLQREELNKTAFVPDPFDVSRQGRLYKTGDLARYLPHGAIDYLGRVDMQVKLFGNRIELMEIEAALRRHPQAKDAVVMLSDGQGQKQRLTAYILTNNSCLNQSLLRQYLLEQLPDYMIPGQFVFLEEFPLTESGKTNRQLLSPPQQEQDIPSTCSVQSNNDYVLLILSMWKKILNRNTIDVQCNFFDAGGNSLLATQLAVDLERVLGVQIPLVKIFQYPTVSTLAAYLGKECPKPAAIAEFKLKKDSGAAGTWSG